MRAGVRMLAAAAALLLAGAPAAGPSAAAERVAAGPAAPAPGAAPVPDPPSATATPEPQPTPDPPFPSAEHGASSAEAGAAEAAGGASSPGADRETPDAGEGGGGEGTADGAEDGRLAPQLSVSKTASPDPLAIGGEAVYTITVTNSGDETARGVTVTDTLDPNVTAGALPPECSATGATVTCFGAGTDIPAGESVTVEVPVTVDPSLSDGTNIANRVSAVAESGESANDQLISVARVETDVEIIKTASATAEEDGTVTYTITVINHGPSNAVEVTVEDPTDGNQTTLVGRPGVCSVEGLTLTCPLGTLAPDEEVSFSFTESVNDGVDAGELIENCAEVFTGSTQTTTDNDRSCATTTVVPAPTPTPTISPSPIPIPTVSPLPIPSPSPSPSPTVEPSPSPSPTVSPSPTTSPTASPSPEPTASPGPTAEPSGEPEEPPGPGGGAAGAGAAGEPAGPILPLTGAGIWSLVVAAVALTTAGVAAWRIGRPRAGGR
ncbi:hypothetical protein GCM10027440_24060 [Nocardiopsis coralliicola]